MVPEDTMFNRSQFARAEIDRMHLEVREYLSLLPEELKKSA